tara:strand:- start:2563 stop:4146 length:1584 start_codon:yes stop_codon:yes gene_type:complete
VGRIYFFLLLLIPAFALAQSRVAATIDTIAMTIGEDIQYNIEVKADSTAQVIFPQGQTFLPFEIIDTTKVDVQKLADEALWKRSYTLIQFDSGSYHIPRQKVMINGSPIFTDSLKIEVFSVEVDTLKQPLHPIKPIIAIDKNNSGWWRPYLLIIALVVLCITLYIMYGRAKKRIEEWRKKLHPFDRAIQELQALEASQLNNQEEYKEYYSSLTGIVRNYLEEEANVNALESTTTQLIQKLELLRTSGSLDLHPETITNLKKVLETADLVKFAKAAPGVDLASSDRSAIESVVVQTKEAIPEPTEEERLRSEEYRQKLRKEQRRKQLKTAAFSALGVLVLVFGIATYLYGFTQVKDHLFGNPTLKLLESDWVTSTYGATPIRMTTPEVLIRIPSAKPNTQSFRLGEIDDAFSVALQVEQIIGKGEVEVDLTERAEGIIQDLESRGATNIFQKQDEYQSQSGVKGVTISGSFDWSTDGEDSTRKEYTVYIFAENKGLQQIEIIGNREDRYTDSIIERMENSFTFNTDVQ